MIRSMTGYGSAEAVDGSTCYAVELRSVNNRYLKLSIRLPDHLAFVEPSLEKLIRTRVMRGSVYCTVRSRDAAGAVAVPLNLAVLQGYIDQLARARAPEGASLVLDLATAAQLPGVAEQVELDEETQQRCSRMIEEAAGRALDALTQMRRLEGQALRDDVLLCCNAIVAEVDAIADHAPRVIEEYHERLRTRVAMLLKESGAALDTDDLMREVAIYAERCDVSEELTRLRSHVMQFVQICDSEEQAGRKLEFLSQELLREANTIASKSNNAVITRRTLDIKTLVDRLKEQVQNVE